MTVCTCISRPSRPPAPLTPLPSRDALADNSATYERVTGTYSLDETGTPVKGATIVSFAEQDGAVTTTLVDVVKELPDA